MKDLKKAQIIDVFEGVEVTIKARKMTFKGKRGSIVRAFKHIPMDISFVDETKKQIKVERWFTSGKANSSIRTCKSHIVNAMIGVTIVSLLPIQHAPLRALKERESERMSSRSYD